MNTEKIEKLKKGLTNSQIPESLREKIRQQISRLEAEDNASKPAPKEEAPTAKETVAPKVAKAPMVRKPIEKKVVAPKKETVGKTTAMSLAKEIRKDGEKWTDAVKRAGTQMKKGTTEVKKSTKTEMQKLLALVKRRKELKGISGTNLKRDSQRTALPKGKRVSENGKVYYENRDNRTDRLAPNYPKNAPLLELGGTVVSDLAGHTGGGDMGLNANTPLNGFSNTHYTGQVGETGAMSSGEMFANGGGVSQDLFEDYKKQPKKLAKIVDFYMEKFEEGDYDYEDSQKFLKEVESVGYTFDYGLDNEPYGLRPIGTKLEEYELGGGLPSGVEQHYVNYYLGEGASQGIYANGGGVETNKTPIFIVTMRNSVSVNKVDKLLSAYGIKIDANKKWHTKGYGAEYYENDDYSYPFTYVFDVRDSKNPKELDDKIFALDSKSIDVTSYEKNPYEYSNGGEMRDYREMEDSYAKGGGIRTKNGRDYSTGRNWTNDHRHHNKGENYEVPMNKRK